MALTQILVVDDDSQMQFFLREALQRRGYGVTVKDTAEGGLAALRDGRFDLVLLDLRLPGMSGLDAVDEMLKTSTRLPIIVMTADSTRETALDAMRRGAYDFFTKPFRLDELEIVIRRAMEKSRLMNEIERLRKELSTNHRHGRMVGASPAMAEVHHLIERVAPTDFTVLIQGESGTGKELVAEAIHQGSTRSDKPFVKLNCAAIPDTLLESELFGHEKGSFTGAVARKLGKFEQADGGTILLDEIGDMALDTQSKILRVLQENELQRVGGTTTVKVDVRLIAATNKDLQTAVAEGRFRDDLYFRLNVITIQLPPLRERREEVPDLVEHFLVDTNLHLDRSISRVAPDAMAALMEYHWPGNIRELKNTIGRAAVVNDGDVLTLSSLPPPIRPAQATARGISGEDWKSYESLSLDQKMDQLERAFVVDALMNCSGVQAAAARRLGVSERSVWHLVKKHQIEVDKIKEKVAS